MLAIKIRGIMIDLFYLKTLTTSNCIYKRNYFTEQHKQPLRNSNHSSNNSPDCPTDIDFSIAEPLIEIRACLILKNKKT